MVGDDKEDHKERDRRVRKRTRVLRNAKIIVPRRSPVIYCTVENITGGGACLKLASTFGVPETFDLTFEHGRTRRSCRVVWRTNDKLGVAFESGRSGRSELEHDPEKACPGLDPGWKPLFREDHAPLKSSRIPRRRGSSVRYPPAAIGGDRRL
jgi:PilZ domain-containing protein